MMQKIITLCCFILISFHSVLAQSYQVNGKVTDKKYEPLPGANIVIKGTNTGTTSDRDGKFTISVKVDEILVFSYVGYKTREILIDDSSQLDVQLSYDTELKEVAVIGSRNPNRTKLETMVPIDVIEMKDVVTLGAQTNINQLLNYVAPSFTSMPQNVADGSDFVDPASLRGMGPDQILVLINGKRRHQTSLVNVNGTVGRGSVGTDMNAIPTAAIDRIEILRDGAAAQYGSDAVAGIINIVLKSNSNELNVNAHYGANISRNSNNLEGGIDGEKIKADANYGLSLGENGGFINFTGEFSDRGSTKRSGEYTGEIFHAYNAIEWVAHQDNANLSSLMNDVDAIKQYAQDVSYFSSSLKDKILAAQDIESLQALLNFDVTQDELAAREQTRSDYSMKVGQSAIREGKIFMNMSIPLNNGAEFYAFGGIGSRKARSYGFFRKPNQERTYTPTI